MSQLVRGICRGDTPPRDLMLQSSDGRRGGDARRRKFDEERGGNTGGPPAAHKWISHCDGNASFAQRTTGMSLDVVRPGDVLPGCPKNYKDWDPSLTTYDILKAQPCHGHDCSLNNDPLPWKLIEKPSLDEIRGTRAVTRYPAIDPGRPRDLSLITSDLEEAQSRRIGLNCESKQRRDSCVDPVNPAYTLPSSHAPPEEQRPPSLRDSLDVLDIMTARQPNSKPPRPHGQFGDPLWLEDECRSPARLKLGLPDVESPGRKAVYADTSALSNRREGPQRSGRVGDPLHPEYNVPVAGGSIPSTSLHVSWSEEKRRLGHSPRTDAIAIGRIDGSTSRARTRDNGEPQLSLTAHDLEGASPCRRIGRLPYRVYDPPGNRTCSTNLKIGDIEGAQAGTLCRGPRMPRGLEELRARQAAEARP